MKNSTLVFRSLAVIIFIAGGAHLASYASQSNAYNTTYNYQESIDSIKKEEIAKPKTNQKKPEKSNLGTDYITGKWKVNYNSKEFKGAIIYNLLKEGKKFNAYTHKYLDENGYAQKAGNTKAVIITSFDGYKGRGIYKIEYEGEKYDVKCNIDMVDENTFKLSYDHYSYSDVETWKKQ